MRISKKLTKTFDDLSLTHPNIAQGYIFGPELEGGNQTSIIAMPTAVLDMFAEEDLNLGDLYEQPDIHADAVRDAENEKIVYTKAYTDNYGTWITVLHPFQDASGEIFAYMGIDVDASLIASGKQELITNTVLRC